jgi:zinc protease
MKFIFYLYAIIYSIFGYSLNNYNGRTLATQIWHSKNGIKVIYYPTKHLPMIDIAIAFKAGSAYDEKLYGISMLTSQILSQGSLDIIQNIEQVGAQYSAHSDRDMAVLHLRTLTNTKDKAIQNFDKIISNPKFTQDALERLQAQMLTALNQQNSNPNLLAANKFYEILYKDHPYGHNPLGKTTTIKKIQLSDVIKFYKDHYIANEDTVLVIVGDLTLATAKKIAEQLTNKIPKGALSKKIDNMVRKPYKFVYNIKHDHSPQSTVYWGQIGISQHNKNYFAFILGNYILGGSGLNSKLATAIREHQGLTYDITSQFVPLQANGPFYINFATKKNNLKFAISEVNKIVTNFIKIGPTDEELVAAKRYLIGHFPIALDSNAALANIFLRIAFYHLPNDYLLNYTDKIANVTKENITQAFQKLINSQDMLTVIVG